MPPCGHPEETNQATFLKPFDEAIEARFKQV
jgi:hypothetical protein